MVSVTQGKRWWLGAMVALVVGSAALARLPVLEPVRQAGGLLLFEAGRHDLSAIRNYTASWIEGSDLTPVARMVTKNGESWVEFTFQGSRGLACSTIFYTEPPTPDKGYRYDGIVLDLDCDRDDYPHIRAHVEFTDKSQVSRDLTLEQGRHEYVVQSGFRRVKYPPRWELLRDIRLSLDASRQETELTYRLRRITMRQVAGEAREEPGAARVPDRFVEPALWPRPKQLDWNKGVFPARNAESLCLNDAASARTRRTAKIFADSYYGFTGRRLAVHTLDSIVPDTGITLRLADATARQSDDVVREPQGYSLSIRADRVVITGADEPGLYYGTVTFLQLLRHALKKVTPDIPVPCMEIRDWPDTPNRLVRLEHPNTFRNWRVRENRGIDYLMDWTDRFVAGNKFNTLYIDLSACIRYERRPEFNGSEKIYSLDDLRRFGRFCRDRFIDLCPAWEVGGHANWWLLNYHPELREKGYRNQSDVTNPGHDPIVYDCMLDVIEALQPKYASAKSDEWWGPRREGETPDKLIGGKTRAQAFLDFHVKLNHWLKRRGITMMAYDDMLSPYHNGKKFDVYRIIDAFPKDVILTHWSSGDVDKEIRYFTDRGFRVWPDATSMFTLSDQSKAHVMGFGKGIYSFGNDRAHLLDEYSPLSSLSNVLRVADYAWNFAGDESTDPARLVAVQEMLAIRPNPRAGQRVEPIDLEPALAQSFAEFLKSAKPEAYARKARPVELPNGMHRIGFVPMRLGGGQGDCLVLRKGSQPRALPVQGRFSSLVFLHTAFVNDPADKHVAGGRVREWWYGWPCGDYVVHYADGSQSVLPVRLTNNIKRFDTASATRPTLDNRYVWTLDDVNAEPVHLFQWEWVNPRPDQPIDSVVVEHDGVLNVSLVLFAISGRSVAER